jgi:hypothetical protein
MWKWSFFRYLLYILLCATVSWFIYMIFQRGDDMVTVINESNNATTISAEVNGVIRVLRDSEIMPGRTVTFGFFSTGDTVELKANDKTYRIIIPTWRPSQNAITIK